MSKLSKFFSLFFCIVIIISLFSFFGNATDITEEKKYNQLDLVVVMDSSGSMRDSDKKRSAPAAVNMLANMLPAEDSRVGLISFNRQPTVLTVDSEGEGTLVPLKTFAGVETIKKDSSSIQYSGDTGIGNALYAATDLLNKNSDDDHVKAIILFTDGVDDFSGNQLALSKCESNEVAAIKWAQDNGCIVYCIGYDYIFNGVRSMGTNGEGLKKLKNISDNTGGLFKAIKNINEIHDLFIQIIADLFDGIVCGGDPIPGDGKYHEQKIVISPSVVEANIRIACNTDYSVAKGKIHLYDPDGNEVELRNSGNIRYDIDAIAASIKIIRPKAGDWLLTVDKIFGDDIEIILLEHFKMNLTSQLIFPNDNPKGVAYTDDVIGIKAWPSYDGKLLTDDELYDAVTSAQAICVSRANPDEKKIVTLTRDGYSFIGDFTIPEDSFYDITVRLEWDSVFRENTLTVASSNKPLSLVNDFDDVKVNKKKTVQIDNIYTYVNDVEGDNIEAYVKNILNSDVCGVTIDGDNLKITGVKGWWADTIVTIGFKDAQGNEVESNFTVSVGDPWAVALIAVIIALLLVSAILILYFAYRARIHLFGKMRVCTISEGEIDAAGNFSQDMNGFTYVNPNASSNAAGGNVLRKQPTFISGAPVNNQTSGNNGPFGGAQNNPIFVNNGPFGGTQNNQSPGAGGLFGGAQNNPAPGAGGLFGGAQNNSAPGAGGLFGGTQNNQATGNGGLFGGTQNNQATGNGGMFGGAQNGQTPDNEDEISRQYNEVFDFGGKKIKKTTVESMLAGFLEKYTNFMKTKMHGSQSATADKLGQKLSVICGTTSKMYLLGTLGGKGGAVLKIDKGLVKKKAITLTAPRLVGNKAELPYYNKGVVTLDFNVITDSDATSNVRRGIRVCIQLEKK